MSNDRSQWFRPLLMLVGASIVLLTLPLVAFPNGNTWNVDLRFTAWIHQFETPFLTSIMKWVTKVAYDNIHFWIAGIVGLYFLIRYSRPAPGLLLLAARLGSDQVGIFLKDMIGRPRPQLPWLAKQSSGFSYPSGSVTVGATFYVMLAYVIAQEIENPALKRGVQASGWLFAGIIAISRIYLGAHWLSDTVAGLCVAAGVTAILSYLLTVPQLQFRLLAPLQAAASDMRKTKKGQ